MQRLNWIFHTLIAVAKLREVFVYGCLININLFWFAKIPLYHLVVYILLQSLKTGKIEQNSVPNTLLKSIFLSLQVSADEVLCKLYLAILVTCKTSKKLPAINNFSTAFSFPALAPTGRSVDSTPELLKVILTNSTIHKSFCSNILLQY